VNAEEDNKKENRPSRQSQRKPRLCSLQQPAERNSKVRGELGRQHLGKAAELKLISHRISHKALNYAKVRERLRNQPKNSGFP
jgi:hypothetical protein